MRVALAGMVGILVTLLLAAHAVDPLELPARDLAMRVLPSRAATSTTVVAIDERSLRERGPWPWPRAELANIVDRCAAAGARAVVFDILLNDPRDGDAVLAQSMRKLPTIAVAVLVEGEQWLEPAPAIRARAVVAHGNFELDHDGILRRFSATKQSGTRAYTALSIEAASVIRPISAPVGRAIAPAFRTAPHDVPVISAVDLVRGRTGESADVRGKLVFVGPTALGLGDRVLTPVSAPLAPDAGVTVHAATTESLLRGEQIREASPIVSGMAAAIAVFVVASVKRLPAIAITVLVLFGGLALLALTGVAIPFVSLLGSMVLTGITAEGLRMTASLRRTAIERTHDVESKRLLAHELKTPIASMRNLTQLLAEFDLSEAERKRVATLLQSETGKLETMVQGLLDLERLSVRDFASSSRVTDLSELVRTRVEVLRAGANGRVGASVAPHVLVRSDGMLMERVIDNLVGNALKYTDAAVDVTVRGTGAQAMLEVADHGRGIGAEERQRIFQRFFRGAAARGTEGLGLGLAFVAEVARWHGGSVSLESAEGGGSLFRVTLPLAEERS